MLFVAGPLTGALVVATDGLLKYAPREEFVEAVCGLDLGAIPNALVDLVRARSGRLPDDVAVVVSRMKLPRTATSLYLAKTMSSAPAWTKMYALPVSCGESVGAHSPEA